MPFAVVRLSPSVKSGFANLPPAWVNALWDTRKVISAMEYGSCRHDARTNGVSRLIKDMRPNDVVLELSWTPPGPEAQKKTAYVGWIGGSSAGASLPPLLKSEAVAPVNHQIIELDSFFGRGLGLQDGQKVSYASLIFRSRGLICSLPQVSVEFVKNVARGITVHVEPASEDDWEILELQAEYLEEQLLSQVRVVSPGQIMSVWIRGQTPISLRVGEVLTIAARNSFGTDSNLYMFDLTVETEPAAKCVKLDNDVEVIVAPKTRASSMGPKDVFGPLDQEAENPSALPLILELRSFPTEYVESEKAVTRDAVVCHPSVLRTLDLAWKEDTIFYVSPATVPARDAIDELDEIERQTSATEGTTGQRRRDDEGAKPPKVTGVYVRLRASEDVPHDHIAVPRSLRNDLAIGKFERVR